MKNNERKMYVVPESFKSVNIPDLGMCYTVNIPVTSQEWIQKATDAGYDCDGDSVDIWASDIPKLGVPYANILWETGRYDNDRFERMSAKLIKPADHYLVFAVRCRWDGASGYKLANGIEECFRRSYDATIRPVSVSRGGKILTCIESGHDVPTGGTTYVIALTEREYQSLLNKKYRFVCSFAETKIHLNI